MSNIKISIMHDIFATRRGLLTMARILITGASRGIGRGTAVALAGRGHEVIATARDVTSLNDVPAALRLSLDVTDQGSVDAAIARAGHVDVLVSNAGATVRAPVETVPLEAVRRIIELNTLGALRVAQAVLPGMRAQGSGQLVFISSIQGRLVIPLIGAYSASKWALEALAETLAVESGHFGISVHVLEPGAVASGGAERAQVYLDDANPYRPLLDKIGGFRSAPITVEEVADAVAETVDQADKAPFRIPVGETAKRVLAARKAAPEDAPFLAASLDW
jgi:NAD(P)-dependent dehydrogenase (short-subunit alcohol dehydrogenase family)